MINMSINKIGILLALLLSTSSVVVAQMHVRGTVYESELGDKLRNVTVTIDGTDICSTTDSSGNYKITVPNEKVFLLYNCEGYESLYVKVRRNYVINVVLGFIYNPKTNIDVGYGTQQSTEVTGAVASIGGGHYQARSFVASTKRLKKK